ERAGSSTGGRSAVTSMLASCRTARATPRTARQCGGLVCGGGGGGPPPPPPGFLVGDWVGVGQSAGIEQPGGGGPGSPGGGGGGAFGSGAGSSPRLGSPVFFGGAKSALGVPFSAWSMNFFQMSPGIDEP